MRAKYFCALSIVALSVAAFASCAPASNAPLENPGEHPSATAAASQTPAPEDATCGGKLARHDDPDAPEPTTKPRTEKNIALALLVGDAPKLRIVRAGASLELGEVRISDNRHPRTGVDVSRLTLKQDVVRAGLPADVASHWDAWFAAISKRRDAQTKRAIAQSAQGDCRDCAAHACLATAIDRATHDADSVKADMKKESDALLALLEPLAKDSAATPSVLVADAWVLESRARSDDSNEDLAPRLKAPIGLYARAMSAAPATDAIGSVARYYRAGALDDAGLSVDARSAWRDLAEVSSPVRAEAFYHVGTLEDDPTRALAAYASARDADVSRSKLIAFASSLRALGVAEDFNRPRELFDAAMRLAPYADADDETSRAFARAIDWMSGQIPGGAQVPVTVFAKTGLLAAEFADSRGDRERAERLRRAVVANAAGTKQADDATKDLGTDKPVTTIALSLQARLRAITRSCRVNNDAAEVEVRGTKSDITITAEDTHDHDFIKCFDARKNWYLGSTTPWPEFHAKVIFE